MPTPSKHEYAALIEEYDQRLASGELKRSIEADFDSRGIHPRTFQNRRTQAKKAHQSTPSTHHDTPKAHQSTPDDPELWEIRHGMPERTERSLDEQYTQEHHDTPPDADYPKVHPGTLEGHQEVMEEVHQSVPDAPHLGTDEVHLSTPEVHQELSPDDSTLAHLGVPVRQDHLISTPMVHPGTPSEEDWELWGVVKTRWTEVEKMLADWKTRQALLSTPSGTPRNTIKKTYVVDSAHVVWIDQYAREHGLDIKDVLFMAIEAFIRARSGQEV
jgi:hypothetical protein